MATDSGERGPPTNAQRRYLERSITSLYVALHELHEEMAAAGTVSEAARQQLTSELATVIVQLRQYRSEDSVDWESATPFDGGPEALLQTILSGDTDTTQPTDRRNAAPEAVQKPARIPTAELYQSALDLLDIVNNLGLAPPVDQSTETVYPDPV